MKKLKSLIPEELIQERQNYLIENVKPLSEIKDPIECQNRFFETTIKLISEGYDISEIEEISEGLLGDIAKGAINPANWLSGGWSAIKEQIIRWILKTLGMGPGLTNVAATFLADYDVKDLLKPFKSQEFCLSAEGMPKITDGVVEATIRYLQFGEQSPTIKKDFVKLGFGNLVGEIIRDSNLGETVANKVCAGIWKTKNAQAAAASNAPADIPAVPVPAPEPKKVN